tara:strand:- start:577 stop:1365 length:789 start_codon:yes stop_codon:yes gene_type:complete
MVIKNEELLRTHAPAAFATEPEDGQVSSRYSFLPTTEILEILQDEGWTTWKAQQVSPRKWSRGHAKHIIRLKHEDMDMQSFGVGDSFPEMLLMNAHNGTGSYDLMGGIFRMVCSNGMVISESDFGKIHIRHIGFEPTQVVEASKELIMNSSRVADKIGTWKEVSLTPRARLDFFTDAAKIRFENPDDGVVQDISQSRREADKGLDLWSTFNVAQENLIRGGFRNGSTNRMVRPITSIQKDVKFNSELWDLASKYSEGLVPSN